VDFYEDAFFMNNQFHILAGAVAFTADGIAVV
jgi:hypothetical protein